MLARLLAFVGQDGNDAIVYTPDESREVLLALLQTESGHSIAAGADAYVPRAQEQFAEDFRRFVELGLRSGAGLRIVML